MIVRSLVTWMCSKPNNRPHIWGWFTQPMYCDLGEVIGFRFPMHHLSISFPCLTKNLLAFRRDWGDAYAFLQGWWNGTKWRWFLQNKEVAGNWSPKEVNFAGKLFENSWSTRVFHLVSPKKSVVSKSEILGVQMACKTGGCSGPSRSVTRTMHSGVVVRSSLIHPRMVKVGSL